MIRFLLFVLVSGSWLTVFCQPGPVSTPPRPASSPQVVSNEVWLRHIYDMGVDNSGDTLRIGPESRRVLNDASYRKPLYPARYTWPLTVALLKQMEIKKALWFLINIYATDPPSREMALRTVLAYEEVCATDKALLGAFYTYAFMDPQVSTIRNGKLSITRPDVLEGRLKTTREMIAHILNYRQIKRKAGVTGNTARAKS